MTAIITTVYEYNNFETLSASKQYVIVLVFFFLNQLQYPASVFIIIAQRAVDIVTTKCVVEKILLQK